MGSSWQNNSTTGNRRIAKSLRNHASVGWGAEKKMPRSQLVSRVLCHVRKFPRARRRSFLYDDDCSASLATYPQVIRHGPRRDDACAPPSLLFGFAPGGVCQARRVTTLLVRSYRTVSPLPHLPNIH